MNAAVAEVQLLDGRRLALALRSGIRRLLEHQEHLNKINVFPVPDGDTEDEGGHLLEEICAGVDNIHAR